MWPLTPIKDFLTNHWIVWISVLLELKKHWFTLYVNLKGQRTSCLLTNYHFTGICFKLWMMRLILYYLLDELSGSKKVNVKNVRFELPNLEKKKVYICRKKWERERGAITIHCKLESLPAGGDIPLFLSLLLIYASSTCIDVKHLWLLVMLVCLYEVFEFIF